MCNYFGDEVSNSLRLNYQSNENDKLWAITWKALIEKSIRKVLYVIGSVCVKKAHENKSYR